MIVLAGVHFMAETAKLLNPEKTVLIPDLEAGCSLAASITAADVRLLRQRYPGVPIVTYVNTSAAVKAEVRHLLHLGQRREGHRVARRAAGHHAARRVSRAQHRRRRPGSRSSPGPAIARCTSASRAEDIRELRESHPGVVVLAHPECPPEVVAEGDFTGSTAAMADYVGKKRPARVVLLTECSMSDNVAVQYPELEFIRPCNLCPHMKRITLPQHPAERSKTMTHEVTIDPAIAERGTPRRRAHAGDRLSHGRLAAIRACRGRTCPASHVFAASSAEWTNVWYARDARASGDRDRCRPRASSLGR